MSKNKKLSIKFRDKVDIVNFCLSVVLKYEVMSLYRDDVLMLLCDSMFAAFEKYPRLDTINTTISMLEKFKQDYSEKLDPNDNDVNLLVIIYEADIALDLLNLELKS